MKYFPKLGQPVHAERYDGTPESVERICEMLYKVAPEYSVQKYPYTLRLYKGDSSVMMLPLENVWIVCGADFLGNIFVDRVKEDDFSKLLFASLVPIKPLEWHKNDAFQWAQGVNCHYEFWYCDCLFWIRSASPTEPISVPVEDAVILAQAHHETQALSLLNLPE